MEVRPDRLAGLIFPEDFVTHARVGHLFNGLLSDSHPILPNCGFDSKYRCARAICLSGNVLAIIGFRRVSASPSLINRFPAPPLRESPAIHTMDRTTPPSTRSADPLVAEARELHT